MAATKSAGRVSIRVLPDSTRFKQDLETSLRRIERQVKAKIEVELNLSREQLAMLKRKIESLVIKITPSIDIHISPEDLAALKAQIEKMRPHVTVDLDTADASRRIAALTRTRSMQLNVDLGQAGGRIAALTRPRSMDVWVNLKNSRVVTNFLKKLQGLSGLNLLGDSFRGGIEFFQNIDRNAANLGILFTKMGGLSAMAGTTGANLFSMVSQLAAMANIVILAPAFLSGLGIAAGILFAAFKDTKTVLSDLGPKMKAFQDSISADFWREAAKPIRDMTNYLLPLIHTMDGTTNTARSLGKFFGEMANSIKDLLTAEKLNFMLDNMNRSIDILTLAVRPLTDAFITLGVHGSKYFERFSNWIVTLSGQFNTFIQDAAADGRLAKWTEDAIQGFKDLGNSLRGVVRVFRAINKAAKDSGAINFHQFGESMNRAADIMNTPRFQATLVSIFSGMRIAVDGMLNGIEKLGPAIETASPTIFRVFESIGKIADRIGGIIAGIISNPTFLGGFASFFDSINKSIANLEPAVKPFADSLGGALQLMGKVLEGVSNVFTAFFTHVSPEFDKIGKQFEKLIKPLSDSLVKLMEALGPIFKTIAEEVMPPLITMIKDDLLPAVDKIITLFGPAAIVVIKEFAKFIKEEVAPAVKWLHEELDKVKPDQVVDTVKKIMEWLPKIGTIDFMRKMMPGFKGGWFTADGAANFQNDWDNFWRPIEKWTNEVGTPAVEKFFLDWLQKVEDWINNDFGPKARELMGKLWDKFIAAITGLFTGHPGGEDAQMEAGKKKVMTDFWNGLGDAAKLTFDTWVAGIKVWIDEKRKAIQRLFLGIFGFGFDPDKQKNDAHIGGSVQGGKGTGVPGTLDPNMFGLPSEQGTTTYFDTLKKNLGVGIVAAFTAINENLNGQKEGTGVNWNGFFEGLKTNALATFTATAVNSGVKLGEMGVSIATFIADNAPKWQGFFESAKTVADEKLGGMNSATTTNTLTMGLSLAAFIAENKPKWDEFWTGSSKTTTDNMGVSHTETSNKTASMALAMAGMIATVAEKWGPGWEGFKGAVETAWRMITGDTQTGVSNAANEAGQLPQKSRDAIGDTKWDLWSSGVSLVQGFANGMSDNLGVVTSAAIAVAAEVAKHMPHSPAEAGPLSGKGYTTWSGRALVKDFAGGMMDNMNLVRKSTEAITGAVSLGANMDLSTDLDKSGVVIDRSEVNLKIYNPVAEPTSRLIEKASNQIRMATKI